MSDQNTNALSTTEPIIIPTELESVVLRELTVADAPAYFEAWSESIDDISRYDDPIETRDKYPTLESVEKSMQQTGRIRMGIWDDGQFVGSTSLRPMKDEDAMGIGYWIDSHRAGNGYATLAAKALTGFARTRFPVVKAKVMEENIASVKVLEKSGYTRTSKHIGVFTVFELTK